MTLTPEQKELAAHALNAALGLNHPDKATALADFEAVRRALAKVGLAIQPIEPVDERRTYAGELDQEDSTD